MGLRINKKTIWRELLILTPFLVLLFFFETHLLTFYFGEKISTYQTHVRFALDVAQKGGLISPHFLYQFLVIGAAHLIYPGAAPTMGNFLKAGYVVSVGVTILLFILLYFVFRRVVKRDDIWSPLISALMASFFMVGSAVNVLNFIDGHHYFGYLPLNVHNGPTHPLLKLWAAPLFLMAAGIFIPARASKKWLIGGTALFSVLSAVTKPSFTVIILPAVGLVAGYKKLKKEYINWSLFLFGLVLPSLIVLAWQYSISFASGWGQLIRNIQIATRIAFIPFGQFTTWEVPLSLILPKLILSILFPLVVYSAYWKTARKDLRFNLGWLVMLFGCLSTYFFVEVFLKKEWVGIISKSGNFTWSGLIGVYILFVAAALFFLKQNTEFPPAGKSGWLRLGISLFALALHLGFGLVWYFDQFRVFAEKIY